MKPLSIVSFALSMLALTPSLANPDETTSTDANGVVHILRTKSSVVYKVPTSAIPDSPLLLLATEDDLIANDDPTIYIQARQLDGSNNTASVSPSPSPSSTSTPISTSSSSSLPTSTTPLSTTTTTTTSPASSSISEPPSSSSIPTSTPPPTTSDAPPTTESTSQSPSTSPSPSPSPTETSPTSTPPTTSPSSSPSSSEDHQQTSVVIVTQIRTLSDSTSTTTVTSHSGAPAGTGTGTPNPPSKSNTPVIVGSVVGVVGGLLVLGLLFVAWRIWGKKKFRKAASPDGQDKTSFEDDANVFRANVDQYHTTVINNPAQNF